MYGGHDIYLSVINIILLSIFSIGIIGNMLSLIVFCRKEMRKYSTFHFLLYLSIIDLLVIAVCSSDALLKFSFHLEIRLHSTLVCRIHTFLTYFLTHMSSIILMVISIDRALLVCNNTLASYLKKKMAIGNEILGFENSNHKRKQSFQMNFIFLKNYNTSFKSNSKRIELIILFISIILVLINIHYLFFLNLNLKVKNNVVKSVSPVNNAQQQQFISQQIFKKPAVNSNKSTSKFSFQNNRLPIASKNFSFIKSKHLMLKDKTVSNFSSLHSLSAFHICYPIDGTKYFYFISKIWVWIDLMLGSIIPFAIMSFCSIIILIEIYSKTRSYMSYLTQNSSETNKKMNDKRVRRNKQLLLMLVVTNIYFIICTLPYCIAFFEFKGEISETNFGQSLTHILSYTNNAFNFIFYGLTCQKYREEVSKIFSGCKGQVNNHNLTNNTRVKNDDNLNEKVHHSKRLEVFFNSDCKITSKLHTPRESIEVDRYDVIRHVCNI